MENGLSWLSLGNGNVVTPRNTIISSDYNDLTNKPIITLNGTNQNPIKLWTLEMGVYILNGYIQHSNELMSEGKGLFVTIAAMMVNGKYVVSAYIPFWEGLYEYILPSSSSETYTQHQIINMVSQENTLTLDNEKIYTPMENYHPSTKKYADDMFTILRNELSNIGINRDNIEDLKQVNRRRDIIIQALLSQNSDKTVTIEEEKHNISLDLAIDKGMTTINELEGSTLVNVSKQKESIPLSCKADTVENTNVANLTENGVIRPIIQGNTLVNNNIQWDDKVVIGNQIEQMSGVEVNIEDCNGEIDVTLEGHTGVNLSNRKGGLLSTTFDSQSGNYITLNPSEDCGTTLEIEGNTMVNYCNNGNISMGLNKEINVVDDTGKMIALDDTVDSGLVDVKIEGKTLVNLADAMSSSKWQIGGSSKPTSEYNNNGIAVSMTIEGSCIISNNDLCEKLQVGKTYTIIFSSDISNISDELYFGLSKTSNSNYSKYSILNNKNFHCVSFTIPEYYDKLVFGSISKISSIGSFKISNVILLEGDHTDKDISYFEGLKSVGQDSDEIEILSKTPNDIDDVTKYLVYNNGITIEKINNHSFRASADGGDVWQQVVFRHELLNNVKPNDKFTLFIESVTLDNQYAENVGFAFRNAIKNIAISNTVTLNKNKPLENVLIHFTVPSDYNGIDLLEFRMHINQNTPFENSITINNFLFTKGHFDISSFKPYQSNKKQILYYNPNTQTWEKPVLRKWDSIEKHSDGKYYYHKRSEEVVLNGSENWENSPANAMVSEGYTIFHSTVLYDIQKTNSLYIANNFSYVPYDNGFRQTGDLESISDGGAYRRIFIRINLSKLSSPNLEGFKTWLRANPVTLVYQLAQEEIYECTNLSLDTYSNQTNIFNNSLIPCNMEIKNSTYDCILFPNTKYTVKLDSNISNDIQVNLGGTNTVVNTNIFEITTPNELTNESLTLYGNGEVINDAMLFIDDMDNVDTDGYFEGMKSSFENQKLPQNLIDFTPITLNSPIDYYLSNLNISSEYTVILEKNSGSPMTIGFTDNNNYTWTSYAINVTNMDYYIGVLIPNSNSSHFRCYVNNDSNVTLNNLIILEGNYTHFTREDIKNLGKYKVEVKSTGKNKLNGWVRGIIDSNTGVLNEDFSTFVSSNYISVTPGNSYIYTGLAQAFYYYDLNYNYIGMKSAGSLDDISFKLIVPNECSYIRLRYPLTSQESISGSKITTLNEMLEYPNMLEEGSVATEYEPYKESIKTLYLNSPLLEGDKIVTYKGNVCHYHKMGKVVLDGSEPGAWMSTASNHNGISFCYNSSVLSNASNSTEVGLGYGKLFCDKLKYIIQDGTKTINQHSLTGYNQIARNSGRQYSDYIYISTTCSDARSFRQWLAENPVTVIYELTNPYYEIIESNADTSIELFSNVSYLSVDTSVPINFVEFKPYTDELTYLENNTQYRVTFNCNVEGKPISISLGGTEIEDITKLENSVLITTPNELVDEKLIIDGKGIVNIDNVRVTKGDIMYNKYFEGMKSSFEMEDTVKTIIKYCPIEFGKGGRIE